MLYYNYEITSLTPKQSEIMGKINHHAVLSSIASPLLLLLLSRCGCCCCVQRDFLFHFPPLRNTCYLFHRRSLPLCPSCYIWRCSLCYFYCCCCWSILLHKWWKAHALVCTFSRIMCCLSVPVYCTWKRKEFWKLLFENRLIFRNTLLYYFCFLTWRR
jgi:hypothetical protein